MFPHATCLCIKTKRNENIHHHQQPQRIEHEEQRCQRQPSQVYNSAKTDGQQHSEENPWILQRHVDFVKINVLSSSQVSVILKQSQVCDRQVRINLTKNHYFYSFCCPVSHQRKWNTIESFLFSFEK